MRILVSRLELAINYTRFWHSFYSIVQDIAIVIIIPKYRKGSKPIKIQIQYFFHCFLFSDITIIGWKNDQLIINRTSPFDNRLPY